MKSAALIEWLSGVEEAEQDDARPTKRRRLNRELIPGKGATSDTEVDYSLQRRPVSFTHGAEEMSGQKRPSMGPPASPGQARSNKSMRSYDPGTGTMVSRSSSDQAGTTSSSYRQKVLRPNGIVFEPARKPLPDSVQCAVKVCQQNDPDLQPSMMAYQVTVAPEQVAHVLDSLEDDDMGPEDEFSEVLSENQLVPPQDVTRGLRRVAGQLFKGDALPRSDYPDCYRPISCPRPDYAYGYKNTLFNAQQEANSQSPLFEPYGAFYWPFLIIEVKSQAKGANCFQAANQCAGGGTIAACGIAVLLERALQVSQKTRAMGLDESGCFIQGADEAPAATSVDCSNPTNTCASKESSSSNRGQCDPVVTPPSAPEDTVAQLISPDKAISFSVAIDSELALLYVHWRDEDNRCFRLQRIAMYVMTRPEELIQLQRKLQQIVAWGMGPRLQMVKAALDVLVQHNART